MPENFLWRSDVIDLHQSADRTQPGMKRIRGFWITELIHREVAVGEWRRPEVNQSDA